MKLARGDMRKVVNILQVGRSICGRRTSSHPVSMQATSMAFPEVSEDNVYLCTGNPLPADVKQILSWLLNSPFSEALNSALPSVLVRREQ